MSSGSLMNRTRLTTENIRAALIAPCGMHCRLCRAFQRDKSPCPGCRSDDSIKPKTRALCRIKNCVKLRHGNVHYCFRCDKFPCDWLEHLDERYRTKYAVSMIDNLARIRKSGVRHFLKNEKKRWACPACGRMLCVHKPHCLFCGHTWREKCSTAT
jgi:hypothetical protein